MSGGYFKFLDNKWTHNEAENKCNDYGRYLASIDSGAEMDRVTQISQRDYFWIGLESRVEQNNPILFEWTDNSKVNVLFLYENWCSGYPISNSDNNIVFIDANAKCWKSTTNSSFETYSICGPEMFDTTNGLYVVSYIVIPILLSFIALIYSFCVCKKIRNELYGNKAHQNWVVIPTKRIKKTAMLAVYASIIFYFCSIIRSIILYSLYDVDTGERILPPASVIDKEYPNVYMITGIIQIIICLIFFFYMPIVYVHLLLRLKHSFNNNPVFRTGVPSKCTYNLMIVLLVFYFLIPMIYGFADNINVYVISLWIIVDVTINILLLSLFIKAIYKFKEYSFKYRVATKLTMANIIQTKDTAKINYEIQSQHELMIEFRRYTVVFAMICFMNVLITIVGITAMVIIIKYQQNTQQSEHEQTIRYLKYLIFEILLYLKEIISLQSIYLSFNFSHLKYKKYCKLCDKCMEIKCNKIVRKRNLNKKIELVELIDENANNNNLNQTNSVVTTQTVNCSAISIEAVNHTPVTVGITFDDYLQHDEFETESHPNIAKMQNAEDNVDALNFVVTQ